MVNHYDQNLIGQIQLLQNISEYKAIAGLEKEDVKQELDTVRDRRRTKLFNYRNDTGAIKLLIEFIRPETRLIIAGDNYDIYAMLGIAAELGWKSTVVGKTKKLSKHVYHLAEKVLDYDAVKSIPINEYSAVLLMTHDYNHDLNLLKYFKDTKVAYLGILGPKKRFKKLENELGEDLSKFSFIHSPTGLEIGAESPEEIALSICAEVIAKMRNKPGGSLHQKVGSIHSTI